MSAELGSGQIAERIVRQVKKDSIRALMRGRYCTARSEIVHLRCIDDHPETDDSFGSQLWYFEGVGVNELDHRHLIYGVMEYSIQFGLLELIDDGVFESEHQRERFRNLYENDYERPSWQQPQHRWLAAGLMTTSALTLVYLLFRYLSV
ncbi:hypothetical protein [Crateriforma conspicua]|uniref:Uncharacterized protein n=1 Tax=Crateriforma conspicua TaxID=2527996 RepID=A0A5C6FWN5_9PLAN|nr:hypothetical protein [Crateriforma conspicua]QDV64898.1 hypothetical protein Mal65_40660 [Crateriforma conspicua]TWT70295.1 hypothetical protein Pan14r_26000 [Crateriforma conspicua]TWU65728.1 hypothetical protein V7x_12770 [Crateriforma conspicua]